jgi:hypothetical protein
MKEERSRTTAIDGNRTTVREKLSKEVVNHNDGKGISNNRKYFFLELFFRA